MGFGNIPGIGGGDMDKSTYDTDNSGVVDDAQKLNNQLPSYYLDRANHSNAQLASTIVDLAGAIDDRVAGLLVAGANITFTYNDPANTLTIASTASGGGLSAWQTKTSNYAAIDGDRLRVDCSAGDVTITLPGSPTANLEIWIQRIDTSSNSLILDPSGNKFKGQIGKDGLFNNGNIGLSERISWINNAIGYLPQHDSLTYQTHVSSGGFTNSTLLLHLDGSNGSTTIVDSSANNNTVTVFGSATMSTAQSKFGGSSLYLPGASGIQIADSATMEFLDNDFTIEWFQDLSSAGYILGKGNATNAAGSSLSWAYQLGSIDFYCDGSNIYTLSTPPPVSGSLKHVALTRQSTALRYFINGVLTSNLTIPAATSINNTPQPLQVGAYGPGSSIGYLDEIAIDIGVCRYSANFTPPTAPRAS